jgi:hypothetical protein
MVCFMRGTVYPLRRDSMQRQEDISMPVLVIAVLHPFQEVVIKF